MSQSTLDCANLLAVFFQKLLIVETRLNAFSGDIAKVISIKTTLKQFMLIWQCNEQFLVKYFKPFKHASSLINSFSLTEIKI